MSKQTGAIDKFIVEWYMEVPNSLLSEKILHNAFEDKRYNKEYFEIDLEEAIRISEELIFQHFKPFGNIEKYRRQKSSFGSVIVNNEKKLREWWEELPIVLKYSVFHVISESEGYLSLHVENFVTGQSWSYIQSLMLDRETETFDSYPEEWRDEPHYARGHIFEDDSFYMTEMLIGAAFEDWWWFREVFNLKFLHDLIDFKDLQAMFKIEEIDEEILKMRVDAQNYFPYLKKVVPNLF